MSGIVDVFAYSDRGKILVSLQTVDVRDELHVALYPEMALKLIETLSKALRDNITDAKR
jgi:hypothetical protein